MKIVKLGLFTALALALSWIESFIPFVQAAPGMKIGLANVVLLVLLELYGFKTALAVNVVRSLLSAALFGGAMSLPYSLFGGISAVCVMWLLRKIPGVTVTGAAVGGAFAHNAAQITVAFAVTQSPYVFTYLPVLGLLSVLTGMFTGICSRLCIDAFGRVAGR